jgi:hypothetical protein
MPTTVITPSNADTYIRAAAPAVNYGANITIDAGDSATGFGVHRSLLRFDLSAIPPGSKVISVTLQLILVADDSNAVVTVSLYRVLRNWTELGATWNTYDGANAWATAADTTTASFQSPATPRRSAPATRHCWSTRFPTNPTISRSTSW